MNALLDDEGSKGAQAAGKGDPNGETSKTNGSNPNDSGDPSDKLAASEDKEVRA